MRLSGMRTSCMACALRLLHPFFVGDGAGSYPSATHRVRRVRNVVQLARPHTELLVVLVRCPAALIAPILAVPEQAAPELLLFRPACHLGLALDLHQLAGQRLDAGLPFWCDPAAPAGMNG